MKLYRTAILDCDITGTERLGQTGNGTTINFGTAGIRVGFSHRQLAVAALDQLTNVTLIFTLFDSRQALFLVPQFPAQLIRELC